VPEVVDVPTFAVAFGRLLHAVGVPVTPERSTRFTRALELRPPERRDDLYWTARLSFVSARDQIASFDRAFAAAFRGWVDPTLEAERGDPNAPPPVTAPAQAAGMPSGGAAAAGAERVSVVEALATARSPARAEIGRAHV